MKYPKIDLKEVRQQARQFPAEHPRLMLVYLLPSILLIISSFISPLSLLNEEILEQSFFSFLITVIQSSLFPLVFGFASSIILIGALFTTLSLFRVPETELSFKDSLALFDNRFFTQTFLTLLLKRFYLFYGAYPIYLEFTIFLQQSNGSKLWNFILNFHLSILRIQILNSSYSLLHFTSLAVSF